MMRSQAASAKSSGRPPLRLLAPIIGLGVILGAVYMGILAMRPSQRTVEEVRREVAAAALEGVWLGAFRIKADAIDPATGDLLAFRASTESLEVASKRATVLADAERDTIAFHLIGVVAAGAREDDEREGAVAAVDSFMLGPFPYRFDIIGPAGAGAPPPSLVTAEPPR